MLKNHPIMKTCKDRWRGRFNFQHQIFILYTFAASEQRAKINLLNQLSKKVDRSVWSLRGLYAGQRDNFSIILETEFTELPDE